MGHDSEHRKFKIGKKSLGKPSAFTHNEATAFGGSKGMQAMGNGQTCLVLLCAFAASACIGGQSGTEGQPDLPATCDSNSRGAVGREDPTPLGTPRALIESVSSPQAAPLRWFSHDAGASDTDTMLTLTIVVPPQATADLGLGQDCKPRLEISDCTLLFQTADGAFNESFSGTVSVSAVGRTFEGALPISQFSGSYDIAAIAGQLPNPVLTLRTTLTPAAGSMSLEGNSPAAPIAIADWNGAANGGP